MCCNSCGFCNHWQVDPMNWAVTEWDSCFSKSKLKSPVIWECCIAFGNTWDEFVNFLCEFQSVFWRRSRAIKNSDYQWYFYVVKCNFNEKRLNDISIGNIKLCQDFVMRNLVNKEPDSSSNLFYFISNKMELSKRKSLTLLSLTHVSVMARTENLWFILACKWERASWFLTS